MEVRSFNIDPTQLRGQQVSILRALLREGEKHMKYYHSTMSAFKYPEKRMKCYDTKYYEEVIPIIKEILTEHEQLKQK